MHFVVFQDFRKAFVFEKKCVSRIVHRKISYLLNILSKNMSPPMRNTLYSKKNTHFGMHFVRRTFFDKNCVFAKNIRFTKYPPNNIRFLDTNAFREESTEKHMIYWHKCVSRRVYRKNIRFLDTNAFREESTETFVDAFFQICSVAKCLPKHMR